MSLYKKIFLVVSIVVIFMQFITTSIIINNKWDFLRTEAESNLIANKSIVTSQFDQIIQDYTTLGMSFSNNKDLLAYFDSLDLNDNKIVNNAIEVIKDIKNSSELLNNVVLTPLDGIVRLDAKDAFFEEGTIDFEKEYFQVLSMNPDIKNFVEKPKVGAANNAPIFSIAVQMKNNGEFKGILGLPINLNLFMNQVVMPVITDEDINLLLVDNEGKVVWSNLDEQIFNKDYNLIVTEKKLFDNIKMTKTGKMQKTLMGVNAQIMYEYIEVFDAYIIVYKDITMHKKNMYNTILSSIMIGILILVLSSIIIFLILKRITDPINKLVEYSKSIASKDFNIEISSDIVKRKDEIGQLGKSYQSMINSLNQSFEKIISYGEEYRFLANHDDLTNLQNRRCFNNKVTELLGNGNSASIIMLDIDNFKVINDTLGHVVGDGILKRIAEALKLSVNENICVGRFGGDEFIIFIEENKVKSATKHYIDWLFDYFRSPILVDNIKADIKFSVGVSSFPKDSQELAQLIRLADIALYSAKYKGKNQVEFFNASLEQNIFKKVEIKEELMRALTSDGFQLVYQPQVELKTGKVCAYEALLRLKNSKYYPGEFIKVAEENMLIIEIGRWVVKEAIEQIARWQEDGLKIDKVSVNFSGIQLQDKDFPNFVEEVLKKNNVNGNRLELEVTENVFIQQEELVNKFFQEIIQLGVDLSIDDFGTGYSSLYYMVSFPVKKIKIDKSLNEKYIHQNDKSALEKLMSLIHSLGFKIVAEGIEQKEDIKVLLDGQCDYVQGYYFSKPIEIEKVPENWRHTYFVE